MNNDYIVLKGDWLNIYNKNKFQKRSQNPNERHRLFNRGLNKWLGEMENNKYLPLKNEIEDKIQEVFKEIDYQLSIKNTSPERADPVMVDSYISAADFLPVKTEVDENDHLLKYVFLKVIAVISVKGLTKKEIAWIESCFGSSYNKDYEAITFTVLSVPICQDNLNEEKQNKINEYCLRVMRNKFRKYLLSTNQLDTKFKYTLSQKIKDYFLDRSI